MQLEGGVISISLIWRTKRFVVEMSPSASLKELGQELRKLTGVSEETMRLLMPKTSTSGSKLLYPFADEHSQLSLEEVLVREGKDIRLMGATKDEVEEIIKNEKANSRIAGFEEEERRLRQRMSAGPLYPLKLPQGTYIFCEFRTLELPGVKLNPPPSEALKRMHRLAADPGIVAIMNKHHWRVGIMSEMAPEGYVGISSVCILGYNKNQGEEISLRLRTDDMKGFRKYEVIKKTLLHELAHMVHSEHDANFHALNSQLNKEASDLDWTRSRSHTLSGSALSAQYDEEFDEEDYGSTSRKLGGNTSGLLMSARSSSVAAAYNRLASGNVSEGKDTDASPRAMDEEQVSKTKLISQVKEDCNPRLDCISNETQRELGFNFDHSSVNDNGESEPYGDSQVGAPMSNTGASKVADIEMQARAKTFADLDQNNAKSQPSDIKGLEDSLDDCCLSNGQTNGHMNWELDTDDPLTKRAAPGLLSVEPNNTTWKSMNEPNLGHQGFESHNSCSAMSDEFIINQERGTYQEPDPCDISETLTGVKQTEVSLNNSAPISMDIYEPDPDDEEMQRIQDPVVIFCRRLEKAFDSLCSEVKSGNVETVLKTLSKIISNVIEHPNEMKFKRLRKANPTFSRNIANYKAAVEILSLIGFQEDTLSNDIGSFESFLVLKRNDPGLLWLAKSSLEAYSTRS